MQLRLLQRGIESAPTCTDTGIDLVAYASYRKAAKTIQVKANLQPKPGGGRGKAALGWWVPDDNPAELVAFVDLSTERIWLLTAEDVARLAQQHSGGRHHLYMYTEPATRPGDPERPSHVHDFECHLLENRAQELLGP